MSTMRDDIRRGLSDIWPAAVAAAPIGLLFGAVAASKGLSPLEVFLMSIMVFAGGAQFAAIELWASPAPVAALVFSTLLINARHVLMGASLAPKLQGFGRWQKFLGLYYMADENWALAEKRARTHRLTPAYWFAMVVPFVAGWLVNSTLGAVIGAVLGDPKRLGADFAFTALFIALGAGDVLDRDCSGCRFGRDLSARRTALACRGRRTLWPAGRLARGGPRAAGASRRHRGGQGVSVDPINLVAFLGMAIVTYFTRVAGLALVGRLNLSPRAQAAFDAIPPAVLVAVIAPSALATGWAETAAAAITALAATRLPLLAVVAVGVVAVVAFRMVL